jgi:3-methyladenine DNA glycosylase AlkD
MNATELKAELKACGSPNNAFNLQRFFKTGPGQYGEGDIFWGLTVPQTRLIAKKYETAPLEEIEVLLYDPVHECRMLAGLILVQQFKKSNSEGKKTIFEFYLRHAKRFNNWDLVDLTCHHIVGGWLCDKGRSPLYELAKSSNLWEQRIAMVSTYGFIRKNDLIETFEIAKILLHHEHDLIHKAVGWMLREAGKRNHLMEIEFLLDDNRYKTMPRTMLRYAIEKFPEQQRQAFLKGQV